MAKKPAMSQENARAEALGTALATIERKYGKGAVMKLSDDAHVNIPVIPTGSIGLDLALGVGGIPRGRISEIFGPESSGKTTLTLHIIAECQKMGGTCAFVDAEHALDVSYAKRLGVNTDELLISQPTTANRLWILPTCLCALAQLTLWLSTLWPRLFRRPNLRATWANHRWAAMPA